MTSAYKKSFVFATIAVMSSAPFWFFYKQEIDFGSFDSIPAIYALSFLMVYLVAVSILLLFGEHWSVFIGTILFSIVPMFFFFGINIITIGSAFLFFVGSAHALARVQHEKRNRLTFKVSILLHQGLPLFLTLFAFILASTYFIETKSAPAEITFNDIIPKKTFTRIIGTTQPYIGKSIIPGFDQNLTVDEYIIENLEAAGIDVKSLNKNEYDIVLREARDQLIRRVGLSTETTLLSGNETLGDTLYTIVSEKSTTFFEPYRKFLPIALAIGFFLFFRTVALPIGWIIFFIVWLLVKFFRSRNIITLEEVQAPKEILRWQ